MRYVDSLESAVSATHRNVQDEVEFLIKGCVEGCCVRPGLLEEGLVLGLGGEFAALPEVLGVFESHEEDLRLMNLS